MNDLIKNGLQVVGGPLIPSVHKLTGQVSDLRPSGMFAVTFSNGKTLKYTRHISLVGYLDFPNPNETLKKPLKNWKRK